MKIRNRGRARKSGRRTITAPNGTLVIDGRALEEARIPGMLAPGEDEIRSAIESLPEELSWDWVRPRLTPLFERADGAGVELDPALHTVTPLGVAIGFGIEIGPLFARVTASMAERWEVTLAEIEAAALEHLAEATERITSASLQHAVHRGHLVRALGEPGGWASSVILAGQETLTRIFGLRDQVFVAPSRSMLLSFDARVPSATVVDVTLGLESLDPHPLLLDPFLLSDGQLSWQGYSDGDAAEALV
jgi:hypothetical protein